MLVKDWLGVVSNAQNIKVVNGNTTAYGTKKKYRGKLWGFRTEESRTSR